MRSVVAVVVAFVAMAALTWGLSIAPWCAFGLDAVLEPARFDGKLAYDLYAVAAAIAGGWVGGALCRRIGGSGRAVAVLTLLALLAGTGNAIGQRLKPEPGPRGAGVTIGDAVVARRERLWFVVAIAVLGPASIVVGGRRRGGGGGAVEYATEVAIAAAPAQVWRALTDAASYASWNPEIVAVAGRFAAGERIRVRVRLGDGAIRSLRMRVTEFAAPTRMQWTGGMPLGLFTGVRTFTVASEGAGARFRMHVRMSGPLAPMIVRSVGDRQPEIDRFSAALKARVEGEGHPVSRAKGAG
jgi:uncharacterized protein YndB with AHSA1/START domain